VVLPFFFFFLLWQHQNHPFFFFSIKGYLDILHLLSFHLTPRKRNTHRKFGKMVNSPCLVRKAPTQHPSPKDHAKFSAGNEWQEEPKEVPSQQGGSWLRQLMSQALQHLPFASGMGMLDVSKYTRPSSIGKQEKSPEIWDLFMKERTKAEDGDSNEEQEGTATATATDTARVAKERRQPTHLPVDGARRTDSRVNSHHGGDRKTSVSAPASANFNGTDNNHNRQK
jgi:hypothetical protein